MREGENERGGAAGIRVGVLFWVLYVVRVGVGSSPTEPDPYASSKSWRVRIGRIRFRIKRFGLTALLYIFKKN